MIKQLLSAGMLCCLTAVSGCNASITTEPYSFPDTAAAPASSAAETESVTETTAAPQTETTVRTTVPTVGKNPLTGVSGYSESAAGKRPVAVMVNNLTGALPQYGIAAADLIFELPVEGGITRLMAVYADQTAVPAVCSVRSARYYYPILCLGMDAVYCHWGLDQTVAKETMARTGIDHLDGGTLAGTLFQRDAARQQNYAQEHTGYLDGTQLPAVLAAQGIRTDLLPEYNHPLFSFCAEDAQFTPAGESARTVNVPFSAAYYSTFQYDDASGTYRKLHSGQPHMDQRTGTQLSFENLLILQTDIHPRADNYLMDVGLSGGPGYYAANTGIVRVTWKKTNESSPISLYNTDGSPLTLNPGKSYIAFIGSEKEITYS